MGVDIWGKSNYYGCVDTQKQGTEFMTVRQAAKQMGLHFTTIYRRIDTGKILCINFGGILFIPKSEVERLKNKQAAEA
ncbi:unnamed protein product [marine sediment metagenome]|uniref:Helix-turn-helix domain-containing protein n=1 Tax=marine sediment metagenome TaxID=412755 RepID=X1T7B4_9ZZZZ